ncbi:hypothetical protein OG21DRAFT_1524886 [Imleria badia]|nr:hypothetical protein OG21DRAFT_1524886 [Imleria badia]
MDELKLGGWDILQTIIIFIYSCFYNAQLVTSNQDNSSFSHLQVLKPQPHSLVPFFTWKHIFEAGVAQKYKVSDSHDRVERALEEVFHQYGKLEPSSIEEKRWFLIKWKRWTELCREALRSNRLLENIVNFLVESLCVAHA